MAAIPALLAAGSLLLAGVRAEALWSPPLESDVNFVRVALSSNAMNADAEFTLERKGGVWTKLIRPVTAAPDYFLDAAGLSADTSTQALFRGQIPEVAIAAGETKTIHLTMYSVINGMDVTENTPPLIRSFSVSKRVTNAFQTVISVNMDAIDFEYTECVSLVPAELTFWSQFEFYTALSLSIPELCAQWGAKGYLNKPTYRWTLTRVVTESLQGGGTSAYPGVQALLVSDGAGNVELNMEQIIAYLTELNALPSSLGDEKVIFSLSGCVNDGLATACQNVNLVYSLATGLSVDLEFVQLPYFTSVELANSYISNEYYSGSSVTTPVPIAYAPLHVDVFASVDSNTDYTDIVVMGTVSGAVGSNNNASAQICPTLFTSTTATSSGFSVDRYVLEFDLDFDAVNNLLAILPAICAGNPLPDAYASPANEAIRALIESSFSYYADLSVEYCFLPCLLEVQYYYKNVSFIDSGFSGHLSQSFFFGAVNTLETPDVVQGPFQSVATFTLRETLTGVYGAVHVANMGSQDIGDSFYTTEKPYYNCSENHLSACDSPALSPLASWGFSKLNIDKCSTNFSQCTNPSNGLTYDYTTDLGNAVPQFSLRCTWDDIKNSQSHACVFGEVQVIGPCHDTDCHFGFQVSWSLTGFSQSSDLCTNVATDRPLFIDMILYGADYATQSKVSFQFSVDNTGFCSSNGLPPVLVIPPGKKRSEEPSTAFSTSSFNIVFSLAAEGTEPLSIAGDSKNCEFFCGFTTLGVENIPVVAGVSAAVGIFFGLGVSASIVIVTVFYSSAAVAKSAAAVAAGTSAGVAGVASPSTGPSASVGGNVTGSIVGAVHGPVCSAGTVFRRR